MRGVLLYFLICGSFFSCNQKQEKIVDKKHLVENYYQALNERDVKKALLFISDSVNRIEGVDTTMRSRKEYKDLLEWDYSFKPEYKIFKVHELSLDEIYLEEHKGGKRIHFLNGEPIVSPVIIRFKNDKIHEIDIEKFIVFNDSLWMRNIQVLTTFVKEHHPELDGFIYDQTATGAAKYLKAIDFYQDYIKTLKK